MPRIVFRQNPILDAVTAMAVGRAEEKKRKRDIEAGVQYQADQRRADAIGGAIGNIAAAPLQGYAQYAGDQYQDNRAIQQAMRRMQTLGPVQTQLEADRLRTLAPIQTDIDVERFERFEPLYDRQAERRLGMQSAASVDMTPAQLERVGRQFYDTLDEAGRADLAPQLGLSPGATPDAVTFRTMGLNAVRAQRNNDARMAAIQDQQAIQQAQREDEIYQAVINRKLDVPGNAESGIIADTQKIDQELLNGSMTPRQHMAAKDQLRKRAVFTVNQAGGPKPKIPPAQAALQNVVPGFDNTIGPDGKIVALKRSEASPESPQQIQYRGAAWQGFVGEWSKRMPDVPPPPAPGIPFKFGGATLQVKFNKDTGEYETDIVDRAATRGDDDTGATDAFWKAYNALKTSGENAEKPSSDAAKLLADEALDYGAAKKRGESAPRPGPIRVGPVMQRSAAPQPTNEQRLQDAVMRYGNRVSQWPPELQALYDASKR